MVENPLPEGVPGGHHAQHHLPYYGAAMQLDAARLQAGYPKSMLMKDTNAHSTHEYSRPLQKVTNYLTTFPDHPMNLVQKDTLAAENYRYMQNGASYLNAPFPFPPYIGGTYHPHYIAAPYQQPKTTQVKWENPPIAPISSPVKSEVKNSPTEKGSFKIPADSRRHRYQPYNKKPKERSVVAPSPAYSLPAESAVEIASPATVAPIENEKRVLQAFRGNPWVCTNNESGYKYVTQIPDDEREVLIERGSLKPAGRVTEEDIKTSFNNDEYDLQEGTMVRIRNKNDETIVCCTLVDSRKDKFNIETVIYFPFLVCGQNSGWASCSPYRTKQLIGLSCAKLNEGDRVLLLSKKKSSASSPKKAITQGSELQNGHRESKVSPYKNDLKNEPSNNSNSAFNCSRQPEGTKKCHTNNDNSTQKTRRWSAPDPESERNR